MRTLDFCGSLWFVAKDVCDVLRIRTNSIRCVLEEDEIREFNPNDNSIGLGLAESGHGGRNMLVVSEPGLYSLVLKSRRPEARHFRRWITHEVIPLLRAGGSLSPKKTERRQIE
ncbi:MAG: Bro-N domain-containing protein [Negativicutes bacterium]